MLIEHGMGELRDLHDGPLHDAMTVLGSCSGQAARHGCGRVARLADTGVGVWPDWPTRASACGHTARHGRWRVRARHGVRHYGVWLRCQDMARPRGIGMVMARQGQGNARG